MKRILFFLSLIAITSTAFSQAIVVSAFQYYRQNQPDKAMDAIDKAMADADAVKEAKTWFYKGNIYLMVYNAAHLTDGIKKGMKAEDLKNSLGEPISMRNYKKIENGEKWYYPFDLAVIISIGLVDSYEYANEALYKSLDNGKLLEEAYTAYQKATSIDPKIQNFEINPSMPFQGIQVIGSYYYNTGVITYQNGNHKESAYNFAKACETYDAVEKKDNDLLYYTGMAHQAINDTVSAIKFYNKAISGKDYKNVRAYSNIINLYLDINQYDKAKKALAIGRELLPGDQDLVLTEANIYLKTGEAEKAKEVLELAAKNDPTNANLQFVIGVNYDNIINDSTSTVEQKELAFTLAKAAYMKAIELKSDYFDAYFNIGALLNNRAAEVFKKANTLKMEETVEYDRLKEIATKYLADAQPYLEKAHELNPNDKDVMVLLKQVYLKTNQNDKFKVVNDKLKALGQ